MDKKLKRAFAAFLIALMMVTSVPFGSFAVDSECLHEHVTEEPETDSTCSENGYTAGIFCEDCGEYISGHEDKPLADHEIVIIKGTPATCTLEGKTDGSYCRVCGEVIEKQQKIEKIPHSFTNYVSDENATCTEDGTETAVCDNGCGTTDKRVIEDSKLPHTIVTDEAVAATCTETGKTAGSHCSVCGKVINKQEETEALGHSYTNYVSNKNATCTADGTKSAVCDRCHEFVNTEVDLGSALGHDMPEEWTIIKEATCTEKGIKERKCTRYAQCKYIETEETPMLDHTAVEDAEIPATCTEKGKTAGSHCSVCGKILVEQKETDALGHSFTTYVSNNNATCTSNATEIAVCDNGCGTVNERVIENSTIPHEFVIDEAVAPTCTEKGKTAGSHCAVCGFVLVAQQEVDVVDHSFTNYISNGNATCLADGTETAVCDICKKKSDTRVEVGSALGHALPGEWETVIPATCTEKGSEKRACTRCGYTETRETDIIAHAFTNYISDDNATCTANATESAVCDMCKTARDQRIAEGTALGHDMPEIWTITKEPTCTETGIEEKHCSRCNHVETQEIARLPHNFTNYVSNADATCTEDGTKTAVCDTCHEAKDTLPDENSALGHDMPEAWTTVKEPTCTETGREEKHCSRCSHVETQEIAKLAHSFTNYVSNADATCTEDGTKTAVCDTCHEAKDTLPDENSALGHDMPEAWTKVKEATCTEKGSEEKHCSRCDHIETQEIAMLEHSFTNYVPDENATCLKDGTKTAVCDMCKEAKDVITDENTMLEHTVVKDEAIAPTCTENGKTEGSHCSACNTVFVAQEDVSATGHKYKENPWIYDKSSTCEADGLRHRDCTVCSARDEEVIPAVGHNYSDKWEVTKEPTCSQEGIETRKCLRCEKEESREVAKIGHVNIVDKAVAATCTQNGLTEGSHCQVCGEITAEQNDIPALGHVEVIDEAIEATCTKAGKTAGKHCSECGSIIVEQEEVPATGNHTYDNGKVTKAATCKATGVKTYTCKICKAIKTETVAKTTTHKTTTTTTKATTSKAGKAETKCTVCGKVTKTTTIAKVSTVKLSTTKYAYDGKAKTPAVTVKDSNGKTLKKGTDYTVTYSANKAIGKATAKVTFKGNYSGTKTLTFSILPANVKSLKATQTTSSIKLTWSKVSGATGYRVYKYDTKNKKWVKVADTKNTSYTVSKLKVGTSYKYAVRAYTTVNKTTHWSASYPQLTTATKPATPTLKATAGTKQASLSWNKISGATGYEIWMTTKKDGKYSKVTTIKKNATVKYTKKDLKKGSTYYFKVRAYKTVDGKNVYGAYSAVKTAKAK